MVRGFGVDFPSEPPMLARSRTPREWGALAYALLIELPHFIMERKMLPGIKQRAEKAAKSGTASQPPV